MWPLCGSPRMLLLRFQPQFSPVNGSVLLQAFGMKSHPQFDLPRYLSNALSLSIGDVNQRLSCDEGMEDLMNRIVGDEICFNGCSGPMGIAAREIMTDLLASKLDFGRAVPVDYVVWRRTPHEDPWLTRIGGVPWRESSLPWPRSEERGDYDDLEHYSRSAISSWGSVRHFKHFLPRLLELTIEHRDDFLDLAVVFGKLEYAQFATWPQGEQDAVDCFFDEYWKFQLGESIVGAFEDWIDTVLCALSNALPTVQRFLDVWIATRSDNAKRHLAAFILKNDATLLKKGQLSCAFWDTTGQPHSEVIDWLRSEELLGYFDGANDLVIVQDFSYAWSQLMAIRSALAENRT